MRPTHHHRALHLAVLVLSLLWGIMPAAPSPVGAAAATEQATVALVALGDGDRSSAPLGCGDRLAMVSVTIAPAATTEARIAATLTQLFAIKDQFHGQSGLYNALYQSDLVIDRVELQGKTAAIFLSGSLRVGGICDEPRVVGQIQQTAVQVPGVGEAVVIYRGGPLFSLAGSRAFPVTGHAISAPFYPYWERNGGLPLFGYPLTDQRVEDGYRVQYFERQRFEAHPENARPYDILFGRIGAEMARRENLLSTPPFQRQAPSLTTGCEFVAATGHALCDRFRAYWHGHGLDFNDPGVSDREALALFGYPISEAFPLTLEDGSERTVQYFERARMEIHPENTPPYDVLLARFGAVRVAAG